MGEKYILTENRRIVNGVPVYEIQAVKDFETVERKKIKSGTSGGYVEDYRNLSQYDKSWVANGAIVMDNAHVYDDALVKDGAMVTGAAKIHESARVFDRATVSGDVDIGNTVTVKDSARVDGHSKITGDVLVKERAIVTGESYVSDIVCVGGRARVIDSSLTYGARVGGKSLIRSCTLRGTKVIGDCELTNIRTSATWTSITNSTITWNVTLPDYDDIFNANIRHKHDYFISPYFFAYNDRDGDVSFLFKDGWSEVLITLDKYDEYVAKYNEHLQPYFKYMKPIVVRYLKGEFHNE